jgi:hypothetical protein
MNTLQKLKQGKNNYKITNFPGTEEKVALVILTSEEVEASKVAAQEYIKEKGIEDEDYIEIENQRQMVYRALRDKDNRSKRLAGSYDELVETLDNMEIQFLFVEYTGLTTECSPFLGAVTDEQFNVLKKTLEKTQLSDLSGASLAALRFFLLTLT